MARLFSYLFTLLYHQLAFAYDLIAWMVSLGKWRAWTREILPLIPAGQVLELGFGPGHLQIDLHILGCVPYGIDESRQMNRLAKRRLGRKGLPARISRGMVEALPFPGSSFDAVVATFPSPYIFKAASAREIARVMKKDGKLVVLLGSQPGGPLHTLYKIARLAPEASLDLTAVETIYAQAGLTLGFRWQKAVSGQLFLMEALKISG